MKQYLLSIYQPDGDPPPSLDLRRVMQDVNTVRDELKAAGREVATYVYKHNLRKMNGRD